MHIMLITKLNKQADWNIDYRVRFWRARIFSITPTCTHAAQKFVAT